MTSLFPTWMHFQYLILMVMVGVLIKNSIKLCFISSQKFTPSYSMSNYFSRDLTNQKMVDLNLMSLLKLWFLKTNNTRVWLNKESKNPTQVMLFSNNKPLCYCFKQYKFYWSLKISLNSLKQTFIKEKISHIK